MVQAKGQSGVSLVEVLIAMVMMVIVALGSIKAFHFISQQDVGSRERALATQKCIQMMEELRGVVAGAGGHVSILDDYSDGTNPNPILTAFKDVTLPSDPLSGNPDGKYYRLITVQKLANDPGVRKVWVRVYKTSTNEVLAESATLLRTVDNSHKPTQVFDFFVIDIENVFSMGGALKPVLNQALQDLQSRNPGLELRTHRITRLSYGRDPYYAPYLNSTVAADDGSILASMKAYIYPGWYAGPAANKTFFYDPNLIQGRLRVDGAIVNGGSYSLADQFNHAMRAPEEEERYAEAVAATPAGQRPPEISYRMLLDRLHTGPTSEYDYTNAVIMNLHTQLMPLPPLRNYSDAARDPARANVRVVTHPEVLEASSGRPLKLRVYSYVTNPGPAVPATATLDVPVRIWISPPVTPANHFDTPENIRHLTGNSGAPYVWDNAGAQATVTSFSSGTLITLIDSELRHGQNGGNQGLHNHASRSRLYGMEYIPSLASGATFFAEGSRDLVDATSGIKHKNTARWVITLPPPAPGMHTYTTWIGDAGVSPLWPNVSKTYAWSDQSAPATERYQFLGDPRHMPYADVKKDGPEGPRFNRYFIDVNESDIDGFNYAEQGWSGDGGRKINFDVPRYFQVLREGLMRSNVVFLSQAVGAAAFYVGLGGEIWIIPSIVQAPWATSSFGTTRSVNEIWGIPSWNHVNLRLISSTDNTWFGRHWLGELYPDASHGAWSSPADANCGNLPTGAVGPDKFYRAHYDDKISSYFKPTFEAGNFGSASLFNANSAGDAGALHFSQYNVGPNVGNVLSPGRAMMESFSFPVVQTFTSSPAGGGAFKIDNNTAQPQEWNRIPYNIPGFVRARATLLEKYYDASDPSGASSALVRLSVGDGMAANVVLSGVPLGSSFNGATASKLAAIALLRGFMTAGNAPIDPVPQLPRVEISSPSATADEFTSPSSIPVRWSAPWLRWDSSPYTEAYPSGYAGTSTIVYNVKYSANNGQSWAFAAAPSVPASPGILNPDVSVATPATSMNWDVSNAALYPAGNYLVRVEGYREGRALHYSYHQRMITVRR